MIKLKLGMIELNREGLKSTGNDQNLLGTGHERSKLTGLIKISRRVIKINWDRSKLAGKTVIL